MSDDATEAAALDQQIAELNGSPEFLRGDPDTLRRRDSLYQQRDGGATAATAIPATPALDTIDDGITAVRAELMKTNPGTARYRDLEGQMEALYKARYGTEEVGTVEPAPPAPADDSPPSGPLALPQLPPGTEWDQPTVHGLYQTAAREGLPRADVSQALAIVATAAHDTRRWTMPELRAEMTRRHGAARYADMLVMVNDLGEHLPPTLVEDLRRGLVWDPRVFEEFARLGEKLRDPMTPQGWALLQKTYKRKIAEEA